MGIPVNVITGSLGVGKTTAIRALLEQRPKGSYVPTFPRFLVVCDQSKEREEHELAILNSNYALLRDT